MFSECPVSGIHQKSLEKLGEILTKCNLITTRDPLSRVYFRKISKLKVSYIPDLYLHGTIKFKTYLRFLMLQVICFRSGK